MKEALFQVLPKKYMYGVEELMRKGTINGRES